MSMIHELRPEHVDPAIRADVAYRVLEGHSPEEAVRLVLAERREALSWAVRPARRRELRLERARERLASPGDRVSGERSTVVAVAERAIRDGLTNEEALDAVRHAHPKARTSPACVIWYRSQLRRADKSVPTNGHVKWARGIA